MLNTFKENNVNKIFKGIWIPNAPVEIFIVYFIRDENFCPGKLRKHYFVKLFHTYEYEPPNLMEFSFMLKFTLGVENFITTSIFLIQYFIDI